MPLRQGGGPGIPSAGSITLTGDVTGTAAATVVSAISGASPILITPSVLEWTAGTATPTLTQATPTSDVATVPLLIQSQAPFSGASINLSPGPLVLNVPAPVGAGTSNFVHLQQGASDAWRFGYVVGGTTPGIYAGTASPTSSNFTLSDTGTSVTLNGHSGGSAFVAVAGINVAQFFATGMTLVPSNLSWFSTTATPNISQTASSSTSAGSGAAGQAMSVTAQAGQAATGASNNGGNGGTLTLAAGAGGTSGSATAGIRGLIGMLGLVGGSGTTPFGWAGQTSPNTVACGTGGTQTISAAQAIIPFFLVTTGTLSSNAVVDFTTNASTGYFVIDISGVGTITGFTLGFKNGTTTKTISSTQLTALIGTGSTALQVWCYGTNNITIVT